MKPETQIRAVAYARVSTLLEQDPNHQLVPIREFAKNRGFNLTHEYVDRISGSTPTEKRKALDDLVKQARLGRFKVIIIYALDRLARDVRFLLNLLHELDGYGVAVISMRENMDFSQSNPIGRAVLGVIGVISQLERELISERIKTALAVKKMTAQKTGSGWRCGRPNVITEPVTLKVLELREQGHSIRKIERILNKSVSRTSIERILRTERQRKQGVPSGSF